MPLKDETVITAEILLDLKCINFSPKKQFKLTSGKKSPIYCDCRRLISFPKEMKTITNLAVKKIKSLNNLKKISNIAGGESAGIPFATLIASKLNLPMTTLKCGTQVKQDNLRVSTIKMVVFIMKHLSLISN